MMSGNGIRHNEFKGSPCGACRFLRRRCLKASCVFAPFFDSDEGVARFAAVHKVFGASNVSKMLMAVPLHKRLDTVVALCYEAVARVKDPVYGCVAHIFNLQQQVVEVQAELAYVQDCLSILQCSQHEASYSTTNITSTSFVPTQSDPLTSSMASFCSLLGENVNINDDDLQVTDHEFMWPGTRFRSSV